MTNASVMDRAPRNEPLAAGLIGCYATTVALAPDRATAAALMSPLLCVPLVWWTISGAERWMALLFASALLLPPLPIAVGDSGPHPAVVFAGFGLFAGLVRLGEWRLRIDLVAGALLAFFCVLLASTALALWYSGVAIAAGTLARVALFGIGVFVFLYASCGPPARSDPLDAARWLFVAAVLAALFACIDFYFQLPAPAGYGPQFVWLDSGVFRRAQGFFYEASTLGNFCASFLVMIAVAWFPPHGTRPFPRTWLIVGGVVLSAALMFSYSRASLLNVAVSLAALACIRRVRFKRLAIALGVCISTAALVVYAAFPTFALGYWIRLSASLQYIWSSPEGVLSGRLASWRALTTFLAEHPWHAFFGIGYKTLPYSDFIGRTVIGDNTYLTLLVETGIVGLAALLLLNYAILRSGWRAAHCGMGTAGFFGTWIFCFWTGQIVQMFSGDLITYWRVLPVYFWVLAVAVRETRRAAA